MNFGRLWVIFVDRRIFRQPLSLDFGGHRLRLSLAGLGRLRLLRLIFPLALAFLFDLLRGSICFVVRLASCFNLLRIDLPTSFLPF